MFVVLARLLTSLAAVRRCLVACAIGFIAPVLLGLMQVAGRGGDFRSGGLSRIVGTFAHPNTFGFFLSMFMLMAIALFRHCTRPVQWALAAGTLICGVLLVFTYARGPWIALVLGLIVIGVLQSRFIFVWLVGAVVLALAAVPSGSPDHEPGLGQHGERIDVELALVALRVLAAGVRAQPRQPDHRDRAEGHEVPHRSEQGTAQRPAARVRRDRIARPARLSAGDRRAHRHRAAGIAQRTGGIRSGRRGRLAAVLVAYVIDSMTDNLMSEVVVLWYFYAAAACAYAVTRLGRAPAPHEAGRRAA